MFILYNLATFLISLITFQIIYYTQFQLVYTLESLPLSNWAVIALGVSKWIKINAQSKPIQSMDLNG